LRIDIVLQFSGFSFFSRLLHTGVGVKIRGCSSIKNFLCGQLGIDVSYFEERIQTIFLDAMPVDEPDTAVVKAGSVLGLSAAMPGIAGALLRKKGRYAPMRKPISYNKAKQIDSEEEGTVVLKVFNLLSEELIEAIFTHGIIIDGDKLDAFFDKYSNAFSQSITALYRDEKRIEADDFFHSCLTGEEIYLKIKGATR